MYRVFSICKLRGDALRVATTKTSFRSISTAGFPEQNSVPAGDNCTKNDLQLYDVAIVGGGMVGLSLACSLASTPLTQKLKIAVIDSNPSLKTGICIKNTDPPDPRVSTVTPSSISHLKAVGAWKYVEQHRHAYFDKMQVWDYTGLGYTRYLANDVGKEALGCVVENKVLQSSLLSSLLESDIQKTLILSRLNSMALCSRSEIASTLEKSHSNASRLMAKLDLDDGSSLFAKLVVGADGGKSRVRELSGFSTTGWNYLQNAIICTVEISEETRCAWQRFLPKGPIALLPLGDKFCNIVWSMTPSQALEMKTMNSDGFVDSLNYALDYGYGPHPDERGSDMFSWVRSDAVVSSTTDRFEVSPKVVKLVTDRMVFPLSLVHTKDYVSRCVALIGDAAHTVHPLAGQGVNLGFGDSSTLSRVIAEGVALGADIGEVSVLKKYESDRKPANVMMATVLDGFQKMYSVDFGPLNVLRAAAFAGAQNLSFLKKDIILYASGEKKLPLFT